MKVSIGSKGTITLPSGTRFPAVAISDEVATPTTIVNRDGQPVDIIVTRADFISLRVPREGGDPYLALTNETVQYGFKPTLEPRFSTVEGLDATADGEKMTLQMLLDAHGVSYSAFQASNFEARQAAVSAADL